MGGGNELPTLEHNAVLLNEETKKITIKPSEPLPNIVFYYNDGHIVKNYTATTMSWSLIEKNGPYVQDFNLIKVVINRNVTNIDDGSFSNCRSLSSITIGEDVIRIGNSAFSDCSSLSSIIIPNNVQTIENNTFSNCTSLSSVTISNELTRMGGNLSFYGCSLLNNIYCYSINEPCVFNPNTFNGVSKEGILHVKKGGSAETYSSWMSYMGNLGAYGLNWVVNDDL